MSCNNLNIPCGYADLGRVQFVYFFEQLFVLPQSLASPSFILFTITGSDLGEPKGLRASTKSVEITVVKKILHKIYIIPIY